MNKHIINDINVIVNPVLNGFSIHSKPSSNVEYFGIDSLHSRLFVQFKNGSSYIYKDVNINILNEIQVADSVGKYFSANIPDRFSCVKFSEKLVKSE